MIREDGSEKTKQLFVGAMVLSLAVWLLYQFWFGKGLFEGRAFNNGPYGSGATEMIQLVFFLVAQIGALALGLFRTGMGVLKMIGSFLFGKTVDENTNTSKLLINVNTPTSSVKSSNKVVLKETSPLFRTNENGVLFRDIVLERELSGPRTSDELAQDAVDALMSGDIDRLNQRVSQLYPEKAKPSVEVKVDESESE
jgi:hypothetical protein